jgi:hypothetical protein
VKPDYEIVDLGVESPDYFQGFGTSYTPFEHCTYGIGDTAEEAYDDALESVAQCEGAERIMALLPESCGIDNSVDHVDHDCAQNGDDTEDFGNDDREPCNMFYHVGIRWNN